MGCRMADSDTLGQRTRQLHRGAVMGGMCCCWAVSTKDWLAETCHLPFSEPLHSTDMPRHWGTPDPQVTPRISGPSAGPSLGQWSALTPKVLECSAHHGVSLGSQGSRHPLVQTVWQPV